MPKRSTGVHLRSGSNVYQWRVKVPLDLHHLYPGQQWAHRCTLGTTDLREANTKAARLYADWLATFDKQRQPATEPAAAELSPEWVEFMSAKLVHDTLAADEETRTPEGLAQLAPHGGLVGELVQGLSPIDGVPPVMADMLAKVNREKLNELRDQMARRDVKPLFQWLRSLGAEFDETTPGIREFLDTYLKAAVQAAEMKVRRDKGEIVETPPLPTAKAPAKVYRLRDVFNLWKASKGTAVGADPNLSHRAGRILSQGWKPTLRRSAVDKCRSLPGSLTSLLLG